MAKQLMAFGAALSGTHPVVVSKKNVAGCPDEGMSNRLHRKFSCQV
jgi:hypothetical protein